MLTALSIKDINYIAGTKHLLRGHTHFIEKLIDLGADVKFI